MQLQHDVNTILWPLCRNVVIEGGSRLSCTLDYERAYSFMDAYRHAPHVEFLNMGSDRDLIRFVERYGPLYFVNKDGSPIYLGREKERMPVTSTTCYWTLRRWLKSLLQLVSDSRTGREVRQSLLEFLAADFAASKELNNRYRVRGPASFALTYLKVTKCPNAPRLQDWLQEADDVLLQEGAARVIRASICVEARLQVRVGRRKAEIGAGFSIPNLAQALQWMCWQDEFRRRPIVFCSECGTAMRPPDARERKFCGYKCAHRVAARIWRRKDLASKRRLRLK